MAMRGVAVIKGLGDLQSDGSIDVSMQYKWFTDANNEWCSVMASIGNGILSSAALKASAKAQIVSWYGYNPSTSYAAWNALLDDFMLLGGVL